MQLSEETGLAGHRRLRWCNSDEATVFAAESLRCAVDAGKSDVFESRLSVVLLNIEVKRGLRGRAPGESGLCLYSLVCGVISQCDALC